MAIAFLDELVALGRAATFGVGALILSWGLVLMGFACAIDCIREMTLNSRFQVPPEQRPAGRYRALAVISEVIGICSVIITLIGGWVILQAITSGSRNTAVLPWN